jgi:hypothetical protein
MINMSATSARKILILAANPTNSPRLRLDEEFREIDEGLKRSLNRDKFELTAKWAVTSRDFYRHILEIKPHIIHFSGHGAGEDGIVLEGEDGKAQLVPTDALASLFKLFAGKGLELVLFNACFSEVQADAIVRYIPYVTGMTKEIGDKAAISFAVAFYDALGAGHEIEFAFDLACTVIHMRGIPEHLTPVLKKKLNIAQASGIKIVNPYERYSIADKEILEKRIKSIHSKLKFLEEKKSFLDDEILTKSGIDKYNIIQQLVNTQEEIEECLNERKICQERLEEISR